MLEQVQQGGYSSAFVFMKGIPGLRLEGINWQVLDKGGVAVCT